MSQDQSYWRNFCMKHPRPGVVRVLTGDDVHDIEIAEDVSWARIGETVAALDPDRVELYSKDETLLRADRRKVSKSNNAVHTPDVLHQDPETARLTHFANLLHRAYQHSTEIAFQRLVDVFQLQAEQARETNKRLERVEQKYLDTVRENVELAAVAAEGDDESNPIVDAFMSGMGAGKSKPE